MIIDLTEWMLANRKAPAEESAAASEPPVDKPPDRPEPAKVEIEERRFDACPHRVMSIDDKQRTVKCGHCKMWLDPVWCLRELFRYYEQRVDWRLEEIKRFEERQAEAEKRREARRNKPRAARALSMAEQLQRAAYNEYQAKCLQARAEAQRLAAGKIMAELERELEASTKEAEKS